MIHTIDHIVILVGELEQAIADYSALGFTVVRGGAHPDSVTHNALVAFADGAYLELIAFKQPDVRHPWWLRGQRGGEGLVDYALLPSDIAQDVADARMRGLAIEGPTAGGRLRPDGQRLEWQTARAATPDLPFLCGDITPRALRVPAGLASHHPNGVNSIAAISVAVADLAASVARYQALLGQPNALTPPTIIAGLGMRIAVVQLGAAQIVLATPAGAGAAAGVALREQLALRGEGPYAVTFAVVSEARTGALDLALAHGARLERIAPQRADVPVHTA
jgi:catechol 2,3-dioxygenase-like lactoylglutathione lyase family enzyme